MIYVLFCSGVYSIIADIPCSIAHLEAHSVDLRFVDTQDSLIQLQVKCPHNQVVHDKDM